MFNHQMSQVLFEDDVGAIENYLKDHPEDINILDNKGHTPLYKASWYNRNDVVDLLIDKGTDLNIVNVTYEETALFVAARNNHIDIVNKLLTSGADANIPNHNGTIAIMEAASHKRFEIVLILTPCSNILKQDNDGWTVLTYGIDANDIEMSKYLLGLGLNINHTYKNGYSYLHDVVEYNQTPMVKLLLERGIDVNLINNDGKLASEMTTDPEILALLS